MEQDISKVLTFQVKRELAEKYFGTRKLIEEDLSNLKKMISELDHLYIDTIGKDLVRIYSLLRKKELIRMFMRETGWQELPFYDEYVLDSYTIRLRLMESMLVKGWFSKTKFLNMLFESYEKLYEDGIEYEETYNEFREEYALVKEEIKQFKAKYSLSEIMAFIDQLDGEQESANLMGVIDSGGREQLSDKMIIEMPEQILQDVAVIPALPSLDHIKERLKEFASMAAEEHRQEAISAANEIRELK